MVVLCIFFLFMRRVQKKLTALLHAPRAMSRRKAIPLLDFENEGDHH